jgi:hypothetical protein
MAMFSATVLPPWFWLAFRGAVRVYYFIGRQDLAPTIGLASAIVQGLERSGAIGKAAVAIAWTPPHAALTQAGARGSYVTWSASALHRWKAQHRCDGESCGWRAAIRIGTMPLVLPVIDSAVEP